MILASLMLCPLVKRKMHNGAVQALHVLPVGGLPCNHTAVATADSHSRQRRTLDPAAAPTR